MLFLSLCFKGSAQGSLFPDLEIDPNEKLNYGMRMGAGLSSVSGTELQRARPLFGFAAGVYYRPKIYNKIYLYNELAIRFKGSNFANTQNNSGDSAYNKLSLIYVEAPICAAIRLKSADTAYKFILLGVTPSYLLRSGLYTGEDSKPVFWTVYNKTWQNVPVKVFDLNATIGYQTEGKLVGFQAVFKYSLFDINNNFLQGIPFVRPRPLPNTPSGTIRNWSIELAMLF